MIEEQSAKDLELSYREVRRARRLVPLHPFNTYTNMRSYDHTHVIRSIAYSKGGHTLLMLPYHSNEICLLFWGYPASDYWLAWISDPYQALYERFICEV